MRAVAQFGWSIRRELWEHRAIALAPLAVAALVVAGFLAAGARWADFGRLVAAMPPAQARGQAVVPFALAASVVMLAGWIVAFFYSLDALHGERRDRSILFWKSMPVTDATTVLAKAAIPLAVIPALALAVALATQLVLLALGTAVFAARGVDASVAWNAIAWHVTVVAMAYGVAAHALWFAPVVGYLLLVSALARRAPFLWAVLPPLAAAGVEAAAFGSAHVAGLLRDRALGGLRAFTPGAAERPITSFAQFDPLGFLATPGLWLGLAFAAICLAAAVRVRRFQQPS